MFCARQPFSRVHAITSSTMPCTVFRPAQAPHDARFTWSELPALTLRRAATDEGSARRALLAPSQHHRPALGCRIVAPSPHLRRAGCSALAGALLCAPCVCPHTGANSGAVHVLAVPLAQARGSALANRDIAVLWSWARSESGMRAQRWHTRTRRVSETVTR